MLGSSSITRIFISAQHASCNALADRKYTDELDAVCRGLSPSAQPNRLSGELFPLHGGLRCARRVLVPVPRQGAEHRLPELPALLLFGRPCLQTAVLGRCSSGTVAVQDHPPET